MHVASAAACGRYVAAVLEVASQLMNAILMTTTPSARPLPKKSGNG